MDVQCPLWIVRHFWLLFLSIICYLIYTKYSQFYLLILSIRSCIACIYALLSFSFDCIVGRVHFFKKLCIICDSLTCFFFSLAIYLLGCGILTDFFLCLLALGYLARHYATVLFITNIVHSVRLFSLLLNNLYSLRLFIHSLFQKIVKWVSFCIFSFKIVIFIIIFKKNTQLFLWLWMILNNLIIFAS